MDNEEIIRQEAVRLYFQGYSVEKISFQLLRSRQWVYKWLKRYEHSIDNYWYKSESNTPQKLSNKTSVELESTIIKIRKELISEPYHQTGAINILYKLSTLGVTPPSVATINRIIKRNNLSNENTFKKQKTKDYPSCFFNIQQMDLIGPRYLKGGFRYYLYNIVDIETHYAAVYPIPDKSAKSIVPCLLDYWSQYQVPDYLQMDNELSFRGSNKHPRGLGLLLRVVLSNKVSPIFIPPAEPWRNGVIENFNNSVEKRFLSKIVFSSFEEISVKAKEFTSFHNENHRYSTISQRTPNQSIDSVEKRIRLLKVIDLENKILIEEGTLIFIRFIRSDIKLKLLDATFELNPELKYNYVVVRIILEKYIVVISRNETVYHIFPFPMSIP